MRRQAQALLVLALVCLPASAFGASVCPKQPVSGTYSGTRPWKLGNAVGFGTEGLAVDADGAPNSYLVDGKGLSDTCDGVVAIVNGKRVTRKSDPHHWLRLCREAWAKAQTTHDYSALDIFGFLTEKPSNQPVIQKEGDPLPGKAFISTTTVTVPDAPVNSQRFWINAVEIPYVVLPSSFVSAFGVKPGDVALVFRPATGKLAPAIVGDGGGLGEASVRLHSDIGNDPIVIKDGISRAKRGIEDKVVTIVFPGKTTQRTVDAKAWREQIEKLSQSALQEFGGLERVKACVN